MSPSRQQMTVLLAAVSLFPAGRVWPRSTPAGEQKSQRVRTVLSTSLPPVMDGRHLTATLVAVHYGPGEASPPHTHACPVIVYVLEGSVRSEVKGQPETIYRPGDSFYEPPNGVHLTSANANPSAPAQFLAFFVCDHHVPLSSDAPQNPSGAKP
jgi:quercetin dioxygenase-like cupin family protein